jgi:hypothetical protein
VKKSRLSDQCTCAQCRRSIRMVVEAVFRCERRWLGEYLIYAVGGLSWCPLWLYRDVIDDMVQAGLLLMIRRDRNRFPIYLLSALTIPVKSTRGS